MKKDKKCKLCDKVFIGEMLFYSNICLSCVIEYHSKNEQNKLNKYKKKTWLYQILFVRSSKKWEKTKWI